MKAALVAAILILAAGSTPRRTPTPVPGPHPAVEKQDEGDEDRIRFVEPSREMRKLAFLVGTWELKESWAEPGRYKRGEYEGDPGAGGNGTLSIREGPGSFSLLCDSDVRNPMGNVTAHALLSWDPARKLYTLDEAHSAFSGVLRLTGRFEKGDLVFRGEDTREGEKRAVRLVWAGLGQGEWTATRSASEQGGRMEPVVTTRLHRKL